MKKKLFTLLVALLAIAGFNANAVVVGIQTGKWASPAEEAVSSGPFQTERGGYAAKLANTPNKLTYAGNGVFKVSSDSLVTIAGSPDRILVSNPAVNFVTFADESGNNSLKLTYKNVSYTQFVVFTSTNQTRRVPDYYTSGLSTSSTNAGQVIAPQDVSTGAFEGFLAIQAGGMVDDSNLLIVVHDKDGNLNLIAYGDYVTSLSNSLSTINDTNKWFPLYVKVKQRTGHWATPADFANCKFWQFTSQGAKPGDPFGVNTKGKVLTAYDASEVQAGTTKTPYSTFTVKQVDYVKNGDDNTINETNNIITHKGPAGTNGGANFQGRNADLVSGWISQNYGTTGTDSVIPLFVLASPENNCKVLSVSRINQLVTQSQQDGGYANQLELRDYAQFYTWDKNSTTGKYEYKPHTKSPSSVQGNLTDIDYDTYTSLQKFAIWIDEDGNMVLYPAASYFWKYGETKGDATGEAANINVIPNAVLSYNDINVTLVAGSSTAADKANGLQIGWWNGKSNPTNAPQNFTTMPNIRQTISDYDVTPFIPNCVEDQTDLSGRFYFLQVPVDTAGLWAIDNNANNVNGYQYGRDYVISSQILAGSPASKISVVVPKEINRSSEDEYWRFPFDSVNMAAHWEVKAVKSGSTIVGYRFINMLGDTLKYNPNASVPTNVLSGGFLPDNNLIAGDPAGSGTKYFGRPQDTGFAWDDATHWFDFNANTSTANTDVWTIHKLKNQQTFFIELAGQTGMDYTLSLGTNGWYADPNGALQAGKNDNQSPYYYYQQDLQLAGTSTDVTTYKGNIDACGGLPIQMKQIYYVPTSANGTYYDGEVANDVINTNDPSFQYQDSLTAYTFLTGNYDIYEAGAVNNTLRLGYQQVSINDAAGTTVNAARLKTTQDQLQFIPLNSALGDYRKASIEKINSKKDSLAYLYNETYKWYLVKTADNKYLSFDTVNVAATTNREKVGLVFVDSVQNAIPVRLYQPLVGDKANDNFLFQFYMPQYTYYYDTVAKTWAAGKNKFPGIEQTNLGATSNGGGQVCFATLSNQSDYIYATRAYTGLTSGARFTFVHNPKPACTCVGEFIDPQWMGAQRLLNLPLNNQLWDQGAAITAWIATGASDAGIVTNDGADKATSLTHTYVTTIQEYTGLTGVNASYNDAGYFKVAIPSDGATVAKGDTTWIGGSVGTAGANRFAVNATPDANSIQGGWSFERDLQVPLYYVQNDEGKYLTVVDQNDMSDPRATVTDVNGVKLAWKDKYTYSKTNVTKWGYDIRALQLFAISGCKEGQPVNGQYGEFIYLPLASYQYDYANKKIVTKTLADGTEVENIFYNEHLGKLMNNAEGCPGNDLRDCWRVGQYTYVASTVKNLVVFNSSSAVTGGNLIPIQVKLTKNNYITPDCMTPVVENIGTGVNGGKAYTFDGTIPAAAANSDAIAAHWEVNQVDKDNDPLLFSFAPELKNVYGQAVGVGQTIPQTQLAGQYYFVKTVKVGNNTGYLTIDVSGYNTNNYTAKFDTLMLTCPEHTVPFFDLEKDGHFNLMNNLAILETPFVDRGLTYRYTTDKGQQMTPIYRNNQLYGYQTYIDTVGGSFSNAEYLTVYPLNKRELTENHIIPYYAFSITKDNVEYFLNVDNSTAGKDSVYWSVLPGDKADLLNWQANANSFKTFKFCLPYQYKENATTREDSVKYGDAQYPPVYLQTLDTAIDDYPYLIIAGAATKYVTSTTLWNAMLGSDKVSKTLNWNIYTADYSNIDPKQVTAWIFGGEKVNGEIWVPLADVIHAEPNTDAASKAGVITSLENTGGVTFINQSSKDPVNYGILSSSKNLTVEFLGQNVIGTYDKRNIWYYRISIDGQYLTDATGKTGDYLSPFTGNYPYGYFDTNKLDAYKPYADNYKDNPVYADQNFVQSFGFRYVTSSEDPDQRFYIVSNANFTNDPAHENEYRYLAQVNERLIFVQDPSNALVFQFGQVGSDGYTDIQVAGTGNIYGVDGGIKFVNTSGKVDIYSIDGRLIKSTVLSGSDQTIDAPRGIAIVKAGSKVAKVVVK